MMWHPALAATRVGGSSRIRHLALILLRNSVGGYDYLTRQVAALDATENGPTGLSYYTMR
jgi:hypothetical protein